MTDLSYRTAYGRLAWLYDWCADVGSLGAIPLVKRLHLQEMKPRESILYVGAGTAEEAILAAARGHKVTILDSSHQMLTLAQHRAKCVGLESAVTFLHEEFFSFSTEKKFDAVALHFFLDIFDLTGVARVLEKSQMLLNADGRVFVADFANPNGEFTVRIAQWCYHQGAALSCALLARQPWLAIEDYTLACTQSGMTIERKRNIGARCFGKSWFIFLSAKPIASTANQNLVTKRPPPNE